MAKTIAIPIPGISIWLSYWLSISRPLLSSPVAISTIVWSVGISSIISTISMAKTIAIPIPGISIGLSYWLSISRSLLLAPVAISSISVTIVRSVIPAIVSQAISIGTVPSISICISIGISSS